jgi:hypothetical protein
MPALTSSPLNPRLHAEPARLAPAQTAGTRRLTREIGRASGPAELPPRTRPPVATLVETRPRRFTALGTD